VAGHRSPSREVFFSQQHHPGRLCASDFPHMEELGVALHWGTSAING
jgi:hypothetical protein